MLEELAALEKQLREMKEDDQGDKAEENGQKVAEEASKTRCYIEELEREIERLCGGTDARCRKMLAQALSQSDDADVRFVSEDGTSHVSGHRGMLCAASEAFDGMFRSGMVEGREGAVRVAPGVSVCAFRGFLEWVYLGECGRWGMRCWVCLIVSCFCC